MSILSSSSKTTGSAAAAANITTSSRSGKIARLPAHIQEDLNQRLAQNQPGRVILPWLNGLSEVQAILKECFNEKRINEQNLSNWRRGGFHEWQHREKYFACFRNVAQDAADIESTVGNLAEHAARLLALQFSLVLCPPVMLRGHKDVPDVPPAIVNTFCKIARAIASLRHGNHTAARLKLQEQKQKQTTAPTPAPPEAIPPILHPPSSIGHCLSSIPTPPPPTEHRAPGAAHHAPPPPPPTEHRTPPVAPLFKPIQAISSLRLRVPTLLDTILLPDANNLWPKPANKLTPPKPESQTPPSAPPKPATSPPHHQNPTTPAAA